MNNKFKYYKTCCGINKFVTFESNIILMCASNILIKFDNVTKLTKLMNVITFCCWSIGISFKNIEISYRAKVKHEV